MASDLQPPPSSTTAISKSKVKLETIDKAVNALIKWKLSESKSDKPQLMPQEDMIYLVVSLAKIPSNHRTKPYKFPLPNPLHLDDGSEICLIIDDRENSKSNLNSAEAKEKIKSEEIPVSKVLKFSKLKTDYKPFQKKRQLCDSYDLFLADRRVIPMLPKLLGKQFFKKKKLPLTVDLGHKNWKMQIKSACSSGLFYVGTGTCSVVKVGKSSMEIGEIVENVVAAINGVIEFLPKKWSSLRSLHLKCSESVPLPIYQTVPDVRLRIEGIPSKEEGLKVEEIEVKGDELSGKKRGRLHEVRYMDAVVDENDDDDDSRMEIGSAESDGKKRKHSDTSNAKKKKKSDSVDEVSGKTVEKSLLDDDHDNVKIGGAESVGKTTKQSDTTNAKKKKSASVDEVSGKTDLDNVKIGSGESVGKRTKQSDSSKAKKKVTTTHENVTPKEKLSKTEALGKAKVENKPKKSEVVSNVDEAALEKAIMKKYEKYGGKSRKNDVLKKANVEKDGTKSKKKTSAK